MERGEREKESGVSSTVVVGLSMETSLALGSRRDDECQFGHADVLDCTAPYAFLLFFP